MKVIAVFLMVLAMLAMLFFPVYLERSATSPVVPPTAAAVPAQPITINIYVPAAPAPQPTARPTATPEPTATATPQPGGMNWACHIGSDGARCGWEIGNGGK
jgi:hypothetical protein